MSEDQQAVTQDAVEDSVFGSAEGFFDDLDREVNGAIRDDEEPQENQQVSEEPQKENPLFTDIEEAPQKDETDWKKRYSDSSREAQKMKQELDEFGRFKPYIEALQNDEGLVNTIRDYVQNGQKPKELKEELSLPEDFVFDIDEAVSNPNSDSSKVFSTMIDRAVSSRVDSRLSAEKQATQQSMQKAERDKQAEAFKKKSGISDADFNDMMDWANKHQIGFEDIYLLKNKDLYMSNVANSTKDDMLKQMKAVRSIPTTASNTNSQAKSVDANDQVFDTILGLDNQVDNLFS